MLDLSLSNKLTRSWLALGEAVIDPSAWPDVMERICEAIGGQGAFLLQTDVRTLDVPRTNSVDEFVSLYFRDGWHNRDPFVERGVPRLFQGARVLTHEDLFRRDEYESLQILNEVAIPHGFKWSEFAAFNAGPALWVFGVYRAINEEPFDTDDARILGTLPDRLTEVATLSTAVGRTTLTDVTNALGLVHLPAIAVDRFGVVLDANDDAHRIFDDDLNIRKRQLTATDREASASLQILMDRLLVTREDAPLLAQPIVVRQKGRKATVIRALPVPPAARNPFLGARALLTFTVVGDRPHLDQGLLKRVFSLTPAEARLAILVMEGLSPEAAAEQIGIKRETARNQLKSIFAKTDTNRQAQLVALLSTLNTARSNQ